MKPFFSCCGSPLSLDFSQPLDARVSQEEIAGIQDGQKILEVAVGTGLAFYEIVRQNPNGMNVGIDLSEGMLKKASARLGKLRRGRYRLQLGSAYHLPFPDGSFDLLINNYMFDLIPFSEMSRVLSEFKRVLKDDGKLVLVNMTEGKTAASRVYDLIYRLSPRTLGGCRGVKLSSLLASSGFSPVRREYHQQLLFPSEVILATKASSHATGSRPLQEGC
jgi:ubiquinone/menaquinone biosynthesis C-methylase UbiE